MKTLSALTGLLLILLLTGCDITKEELHWAGEACKDSKGIFKVASVDFGNTAVTCVDGSIYIVNDFKIIK